MKWALFFMWTTSLSLIGCLGSAPDYLSNADSLNVLSDQAMMDLIGGDSCKDCQYSGFRKDECFHRSYYDPCSTTECIANYIVEDTCTPGTGTCDGVLNTYKVAWIQYRRLASGCSSNYPYDWITYAETYFGHGCTKRTYETRCTKPSNSCNGTLISSTTYTPGILCQ